MASPLLKPERLFHLVRQKIGMVFQVGEPFPSGRFCRTHPSPIKSTRTDKKEVTEEAQLLERVGLLDKNTQFRSATIPWSGNNGYHCPCPAHDPKLSPDEGDGFAWSRNGACEVLRTNNDSAQEGQNYDLGDPLECGLLAIADRISSTKEDCRRRNGSVLLTNPQTKRACNFKRFWLQPIWLIFIKEILMKLQRFNCFWHLPLPLIFVTACGPGGKCFLIW